MCLILFSKYIFLLHVSNIVIVIKCVDGFISQMFLECRFFSLRIVWMYHVFCSWQEVHLEKKSCEFPEPAKQTCNWRRRCSIIGSSVKPFWFSGSYMNFLDDMQRVVWFERHLERIENGMIMTFIALFKEFPSTSSLIKVNTFAIIYSCHRTMYNRKHATTVRKYKKIHIQK